MHAWTRAGTAGKWKRYRSAMQALVHLASCSDELAVLFSSNPDMDLAEILAFIDLASRLQVRPGAVVIATPHPAAEWLARLVEAGVGGLMITASMGCDGSDVRTRHAGEAVARMCPQLHARTLGKKTLSVCGAHNDRMVIVQHHLDAWCLENHSQCPHRNM